VVLISMAYPAEEKTMVPKGIRLALGGVILIGLLQILMGTQIRQQIDDLYASGGGQDRHLWIDQLSTIFYIHRSFSWMIVLTTVFIWLKSREKGIQLPGIRSLLGVISIAVLSGATLAYLNMPAIVQPLHLMLSCIMLVLQMWMFSRVKPA
jgi:heme a synthase